MEGVLSVDGSESKGTETRVAEVQAGNSGEKFVEAHPVVNSLATNLPRNVKREISNLYCLVLEVCFHIFHLHPYVGTWK